MFLETGYYLKDEGSSCLLTHFLWARSIVKMPYTQPAFKTHLGAIEIEGFS